MKHKQVKLHAVSSGNAPLAHPQFFAHFVPWFTLVPDAFSLHPDDAASLDWQPDIEPMRHWRDARAGYGRTHLHMPAPGVYDVRDPKIGFWQIEQALDHGITGFIINWYGKYSVENILTLHWLRLSEAWNQDHPDRPFHYFLSLDSQARWPSEGKRPVSLEEDLIYIRDVLIQDHYLLRDGRFVFAAFPYDNDCAVWVATLEKVFGSDRTDLIWMNATPGEGEAAAYPWIRPDQAHCQPEALYSWDEPDNPGTEWLSRFYAEANANGETVEYLMGALWPGFDDQLVSWAWRKNPNDPSTRPRVMCRESSLGNTLEATASIVEAYIQAHANGEAAARVPMPLVQVVTWNDYAEASTVEPTRDYGLKPLQQIAACVQRLRN